MPSFWFKENWSGWGGTVGQQKSELLWFGRQNYMTLARRWSWTYSSSIARFNFFDQLLVNPFQCWEL
jgi:hypothetical protein